MKCFTTTSTHYPTRYHIFSFSLIWFESICNGITCNTGKLIKKMNFNISFKKLTTARGNPLQISENHANYRENVR